jgi:hypothetical protein
MYDLHQIEEKKIISLRYMPSMHRDVRSSLPLDQ